MLFSLASTDGARWRRLIVAAGAALLILGAVATYSLLAQRHDTSQPPSETGSDFAFSQVGPTEAAPSTTLLPVAAGSDPEIFARQVAEALFAWDTATITTPTALTEPLVEVADPTGESSAGLVADVANYLPTLDAWAELRRYETRQWIEISSTEVPGLWPTAVQQPVPMDFCPARWRTRSTVSVTDRASGRANR